MRNLIVGVPVRNDLDSLREMVYSLIDSTKFFDKIVFVIGEGTNKETMDYLTDLSDNPRYEVLNKQTKTPLEAYNILFELAKNDKCDLFLTQTDVIFPKLYKRDWLESMNRIAKNEKIGAVTSINGGGISGPDYVDGFHWLGGWCVYYPLRTLELVGGYDVNFPNGYGVDIDHSYRIKQAGFNILALNYWVDHHMMNEREHDRNDNAQEQMKASSKYFKEKWKNVLDG